MAKKSPLHPKHPEHPAEMLGDDWYRWGDWSIEDAPDPSASAPER